MIIADTGFLVSAFEKREKHHASAQQWLASHAETLCTVEAVISECCLFLQGAPRIQLLKAVMAGALQMQPLDGADHQRIAKLAEKYQDQDADYADLALIALAERINCQRILTLDERDFAVYRIQGRKRFELLAWQRSA
jgi:uncharacterized protein